MHYTANTNIQDQLVLACRDAASQLFNLKNSIAGSRLHRDKLISHNREQVQCRDQTPVGGSHSTRSSRTASGGLGEELWAGAAHDRCCHIQVRYERWCGADRRATASPTCVVPCHYFVYLLASFGSRLVSMS